MSKYLHLFLFLAGRLIKIDLKLCNHFKVLPTEQRWKDLSWIHKILLYREIQDDKSESNQLISDVIKHLEPWFDKEMWVAMKESEEETRENTNWGKTDDDLEDISDETSDDMEIVD